MNPNINVRIEIYVNRQANLDGKENDVNLASDMTNLKENNMNEGEENHRQDNITYDIEEVSHTIQENIHLKEAI